MLTLRRPTQAEAVQALLESGADPNLQNLRGDNAAHIAAREGNLEVQQPSPDRIYPRSIPPDRFLCLGLG